MSAGGFILVDHYKAINAEIPLRPLRTADDYAAAVEAMNRLLDEGGAGENSPLADLAATLGTLIAEYDSSRYAFGGATGIEVLRFLMEQHQLRQSDLPEVGSQGVVSEILSGKRELTVRHMRDLGLRFGVPPSVFL
jgi:HTH-type transcriptional regulator / antitoxin HigA